MEENMNVENEISLSEIFTLLLKKIKWIIVLCLTACFVGGVFGYAQSYDVVYYGTELTFFVTPKKTNSDNVEVIYGTYGNTIMDSMVKLLSTEKSVGIYLDDVQGIEGLPTKPVYEEGMDLAVYENEVKEYNKYIYTIRDSLKFKFKIDEKTTADTESKNFIYVTIEILEEEFYTKEFTRQLLISLQKNIPHVVENAMLNPDESQYSQTSCTLVTPLYPMVKVMNPNYALKQTIKFAIFLAFAVFVATCAVIIINDRMDKRIRDAETIENKFNVPLLGVIPSIDMTEQTVVDTTEQTIDTAEQTEGGQSK